jgi:formamidopyrimidine-DNA glycosylase
MLELPETTTLARQVTDTLTGRTVTAVFNATQPHKLTWFTGDPEAYPALLTGRKVVGAYGRGPFLDIVLEGDGGSDGDVHLALSDGVMLRYYTPGAKVPENYQLLVIFDDGGFLVCTVAMYGGIQAFAGTLDNPYYKKALAATSPLSDNFDETYFETLLETTIRAKRSISAKALLATEQRIPGVGNGVLQDILFRAGINPRRKMATVDAAGRHILFEVFRDTLAEMTSKGGRDTERDIFGVPGGYRSILSKNTWQDPCPVCGAAIVKEPYLGGAVYYCPRCQQ